MPLSFPTNPFIGQTYVDTSGIAWVFIDPTGRGHGIWQPTNTGFNDNSNNPFAGTGAGGTTNPFFNSFGGGGGATDITYDPTQPWGGGGQTNLGGGGGNQGGGQGQGWWNTTLGSTAINTGLNFLVAIMSNKAQAGADEKNQKAIDERIRQAIATLSPEHVMALAQQYLPQMGANANAAGQTAIAGVREQAARTGQLEGPRALSFEAGTRAKLASDVQRQAFEGAFNTASGQASAITGAPYAQIQPRMSYANALLNSVQQAYQNRFYQQVNQQNKQQVPYRYPGSMNSGNVANPMSDPAFKANEGTPYQWPFNPARY